MMDAMQKVVAQGSGCTCHVSVCCPIAVCIKYDAVYLETGSTPSLSKKKTRKAHDLEKLGFENNARAKTAGAHNQPLSRKKREIRRMNSNTNGRNPGVINKRKLQQYDGRRYRCSFDYVIEAVRGEVKMTRDPSEWTKT